MKIKVLIAEDERLVREELAYLLGQEEDIVLCPGAENGTELLERTRQYEPDVIFLDIHMPALSGLDAAQQLAASGKKPLFVFVTAYEEHAIAAFELEAVDYLLKPYDEDRLQETLSRVRKHLRNPPTRQTHASKLLINESEKMVLLHPHLIHYAARVERSVEIHTENEVVKTNKTLQELEEKLAGYPFFRPHRSYLVNLELIHEITPWFNGAYNIILQDRSRTQIPVSRSAAKRLFALLDPPAT